MQLFPVESSDPRIEGISNGVAKVIQKSGELFTPEDVIGQIRSGDATCLMGEGEFAVVKFGSCQWTGEKYMHVWVAWSIVGDAVDRCWPDLQQFARWAGCSSIEWSSPRAGWERRSRKMGAKIKSITFKKDLI